MLSASFIKTTGRTATRGAGQGDRPASFGPREGFVGHGWGRLLKCEIDRSGIRAVPPALSFFSDNMIGVSRDMSFVSVIPERSIRLNNEQSLQETRPDPILGEAKLPPTNKDCGCGVREA